MLLRNPRLQKLIGGTIVEWLGIDMAARAEMLAGVAGTAAGGVAEGAA